MHCLPQRIFNEINEFYTQMQAQLFKAMHIVYDSVALDAQQCLRFMQRSTVYSQQMHLRQSLLYSHVHVNLL